MTLSFDPAAAAIGGSGLAATLWRHITVNKHVANRILIELGNRKVIFADFADEDETRAYDSVGSLRPFLLTQASTARSGSDLQKVIRAMASACMNFQAAGDGPGSGAKARAFIADRRLFESSLDDFRFLIGIKLGEIVLTYNLDIDAGLFSSLPPEVQDLVKDKKI